MRHQTDRRHASAHRADDARIDLRSEVLFLRSHDHRRGYDLEVEVRSGDDGTGFAQRYYLQPGQAVSELDAVDDGTFEVQVTMDNRVERQLECRIDSTPEHTVVIEVGNGALSLTEGLAG